MAYAAAAGSDAAKLEGAAGFTYARWHGAIVWASRNYLGTMPHSLIGCAGSTLRAAEMFRATLPDESMTVLVDYFGREISDALAVCARGIRRSGGGGDDVVPAHTHGGRFVEGLDPAESYAVLERYVARRCHPPLSQRRYCASWSAPAFPRRRSGACAS